MNPFKEDLMKWFVSKLDNLVLFYISQSWTRNEEIFILIK